MREVVMVLAVTSLGPGLGDAADFLVPQHRAVLLLTIVPPGEGLAGGGGGRRGE